MTERRNQATKTFADVNTVLTTFREMMTSTVVRRASASRIVRKHPQRQASLEQVSRASF
jgi:hypothetical protein